MKYIIASDFDGTLYQHHKGGISKETLEGVEKFRSEGNVLAIATGRCYQWSFPVFKKDNPIGFDYVISNGGAAAFDKDGNMVYCDEICVDDSFARRLMDRLVEISDDGCYMEIDRKWHTFCRDDTDCADELSDISIVDDVKSFVSATAVFKEEKTAKEYATVLAEEFGMYLTLSQNGRCIDITAKGVNKANGVKKLADMLGIDKDNIYTVGDNYNDISMISAFHGCAVENAVDELKKAAEYVCEDVGELVEIILSKEKNND